MMKRFAFYEYNHLYFTEQSKDENDLRNQKFNQEISNMQTQYPSVVVRKIVLAVDKHGCFPFPLFETSQPDAVPLMKKIFDEDLELFPLELYQEFQGTNRHLEQVLQLDPDEIPIRMI
ncbi:hypothetical protein KHA90_22505 [Flavobacterium psychroterrae]|uniref:Uncharacterized protein n=1 Tax=Flavobacterium psychroterrae TaxID=2133767 RepID=A0ABS5PHK7_9FLAO|nr:hypothetical protein [Flavobacterium psychroterrae]MBS7233793.1 hypothetical protein [Flavobacterium psychroterrae]